MVHMQSVSTSNISQQAHQWRKFVNHCLDIETWHHGSILTELRSCLIWTHISLRSQDLKPLVEQPPSQQSQGGHSSLCRHWTFSHCFCVLNGWMLQEVREVDKYMRWYLHDWAYTILTYFIKSIRWHKLSCGTKQHQQVYMFSILPVFECHLMHYLYNIDAIWNKLNLCTHKVPTFL